MGFLDRRRAAEFNEQLQGVGDMADSLVDLELEDGDAQELRVAVERRLQEDWEMPEPWDDIAGGYPYAQDDDASDEEIFACNDAVEFGYVLREIELERPDAKPVPGDIAVRLSEIPPETEKFHHVAYDLAIDRASSRLPEIRTLEGEAWRKFEYWASQFNVRRSRGRRRDKLIAAGLTDAPAIPANVDYDAALSFGYAIHCCQEASDFADANQSASLTGDEAEANEADNPPGIVPTQPSNEYFEVTGEDLLTRTEEIFVTTSAPSNLAAGISMFVLQELGIPEGSPKWAPALGCSLFGYAARMAQMFVPLSPSEIEPRGGRAPSRRRWDTADGGWLVRRGKRPCRHP